MSSLVDRWHCGILGCQTENVIQTRAQVCPLEDLFRTKPGVTSTQVRSVKEPDITDLFVCFVCLGSVTAFFPRGQLPKEDLRSSPSTTQATRHPRALSQSLFPLPPYFCHECLLHPVRTLPCPPVLYIYPIESLVCFFLVFLSYTYIQTPQKRTPQHISNPTNKLC